MFTPMVQDECADLPTVHLATAPNAHQFRVFMNSGSDLNLWRCVNIFVLIFGLSTHCKRRFLSMNFCCFMNRVSTRLSITAIRIRRQQFAVNVCMGTPGRHQKVHSGFVWRCWVRTLLPCDSFERECFGWLHLNEGRVHVLLPSFSDLVHELLLCVLNILNQLLVHARDLIKHLVHECLRIECL